MTNENLPHGYVKDAGYPTTYFRELSPVWLNYVAALGGLAPRDLDTKFSYLELGSGPAFSTIVHAACFPSAEFHACDFNAESIETGSQYSHELAVENVRFHPISFADLNALELPDFDFIVLHGVYSWVGQEARKTICQLIRRRLKVGGLVYLSYNCMPGWTNELPLRKLMIELASSASGDSPERVAEAVRSLAELSNSGLKFFRTNPAAVSAVDAYSRSPSNYLAHEFLNETWEPQYSVDVADEMLQAGLSYVGSATLVDNHETLVVDSASAKAIAEMSTARQRQLATDFAVDRQFRRDVFVRADQRIDNADPNNFLGDVNVGCIGDPENIQESVQVPRGKISFQADFIGELRSLMSGGSATLAELASSLGGESRRDGEIVRNLLYLLAAGELTPFACSSLRTKTGGAVNFASETVRRMFCRVVTDQAVGQVASKLVGGGVEVSSSDAQTVLDCVAGGQQIADESALLLIARLKRIGLLVWIDHLGKRAWPIEH